MSFSVQIGLLLAVATALTSIVSFLYKHRGAVAAPAVEFRRPVRSSLLLFRSGWYTLGIVIALGSWGLHAAALSLAPISLVQSVIAGGLVMLTVVADRAFGISVTRREWIGVALAGAGLAFLAATLEGAGDSAHADYAPLTIAVYISVVAGVGLAVAAAARGSGHAGWSTAHPPACSGEHRTSRSRGPAAASTRVWRPSSCTPSRPRSWSPRWSGCWSPLAAFSSAMRCR
jgi:hypothetical protein